MVSNNVSTGAKNCIFSVPYAQNYSTFPTFIHIMSTMLSSDSERAPSALDVEVISVRQDYCMYTREYRSFRSDSLSNVLFIWLYVWARGFGLCFIPLLPLERGPDMCGLETPGAWWWGSKLINFRWIHKRACSQLEKPLSHCLFIWAAVWPKSEPTGFGANVGVVTRHHFCSNKVISKRLPNLIF